MTCRELETTGRELETTGRELETIGRELETTGRELGTTGRELEITGRELEITSRELEITGRELEITGRESRTGELETTGRELGTTGRELETASWGSPVEKYRETTGWKFIFFLCRCFHDFWSWRMQQMIWESFWFLWAAFSVMLNDIEVITISLDWSIVEVNFNPPGGGGGDDFGWKCAARSWKPLPYFRPKFTIFHTLFQTWLQNVYPISDLRSYVIHWWLTIKMPISCCSLSPDLFELFWPGIFSFETFSARETFSHLPCTVRGDKFRLKSYPIQDQN